MQSYYESYWERDNPPPLDDPLAATRSEIFWRLVGGLENYPVTFLDSGCGAGWLAGAASARGLRSIGIDIAGNAFENAGNTYPGVEFVAHSVEDRPWPVQSGSIDVIASFEVIEHLLRPEEFARGVADSLTVGGHVAISTPYHGLLKNLAIAVHGFEKHYNPVGDHIRFFTDRALREILERNGFRVLDFIHFGRVRGLWAGVIVWAERV